MSHANDASDAAPRELPLLVGARPGEPEVLLLIGAPVQDVVHVRRWTSDDWSASPQSLPEDAAQLLRWVEAQAARGRSLNQSLYAVRLWLRDPDASAGTR